MRLITIREHRYPPMTNHKIGEEYDATKGDAVVLVAAGLAKRADIDSGTYETKEEKPQPMASEKLKTKLQTKRRYNRKDMRTGE